MTAQDVATGLSDEDVNVLGWLMNRMRPDLHRAGAEAHIAKVRDRPFSDVARAVVAFAGRTDQRSPAAFPLEGPHWRQAPAVTATPSPPAAEPVESCELCSEPWSNHEPVDGHRFTRGGFVAAGADALARARALRVAVREGQADDQA